MMYKRRICIWTGTEIESRSPMTSIIVWLWIGEWSVLDVCPREASFGSSLKYDREQGGVCLTLLWSLSRNYYSCRSKGKLPSHPSVRLFDPKRQTCIYCVQKKLHGLRSRFWHTLVRVYVSPRDFISVEASCPRTNRWQTPFQGKMTSVIIDSPGSWENLDTRSPNSSLVLLISVGTMQ